MVLPASAAANKQQSSDHSTIRHRLRGRAEASGTDVLRAMSSLGSKHDGLRSADSKKMFSFELKKRAPPSPHELEAAMDRDLRHLGSPRSRRLMDGGDGAGLMPLFTGLGTHYIAADVGTPPQTVALIIDTGSFNMAFPCSGCQNSLGGCRGGGQDFWDPAKSSTVTLVGCDSCRGRSFKCDLSEEQECTYKQSYSEGSSWHAYQVSDMVSLGGKDLDLGNEGGSPPPPSRLHFGCITHQSGMFDTQVADGIIGISPHQDSVLWQMANMQDPKDRIFSLCYSPNGGSMVIGGYDSKRNFPGYDMQYAPSVMKHGWFSVKVQGLSFGGVHAEDDLIADFRTGLGTILDSGTTDTYLPRSLADGIEAIWHDITGKPFENCYAASFCMSFTDAELSRLPVLTVTLEGGVELSLTPEVYMDADPHEERVGITAYAPRIYVTEKVGAVLGANVMMNKNIVFDVGSSRVGFAPAQCDLLNGDGSKQVHNPPPSNAIVNKRTRISRDDDDRVRHDRTDDDEDSQDDGRVASTDDGEGGSYEQGGSMDDDEEGEGGDGENGGVTDDEEGGGMGSGEGEGDDDAESGGGRLSKDCMDEWNMSDECDAECPSDLEGPMTVQGLRYWQIEVITPAQGRGTPCLSDMNLLDLTNVQRCSIECPGAESTTHPASETEGNRETDLKRDPELKHETELTSTKESHQRQGTAAVIAGLRLTTQGAVKLEPAERSSIDPSSLTKSRQENIPTHGTPGGECVQRQRGVWGPCGESCEQERYLENDCRGKRESRSCRIGDACSLSKQGMVATMSLTVEVDKNIYKKITNSSSGSGIENASSETASGSGSNGKFESSQDAQQVVVNAIAEAVVERFGGICDVLPGGVDVVLGEVLDNDQRRSNHRDSPLESRRSLTSISDAAAARDDGRLDNDQRDVLPLEYDRDDNSFLGRKKRSTRRQLSSIPSLNNNNDQHSMTTAQVTIYVTDFFQFAHGNANNCMRNLCADTLPEVLNAAIAQPGRTWDFEDGGGVGGSLQENLPLRNDLGGGGFGVVAGRADVKVLSGGNVFIRRASIAKPAAEEETSASAEEPTETVYFPPPQTAVVFDSFGLRAAAAELARLADQNVGISDNTDEVQASRKDNEPRFERHDHGNKETKEIPLRYGQDVQDGGSTRKNNASVTRDGSAILGVTVQTVGVVLLLFAVIVARRSQSWRLCCGSVRYSATHRRKRSGRGGEKEEGGCVEVEGTPFMHDSCGLAMPTGHEAGGERERDRTNRRKRS